MFVFLTPKLSLPVIRKRPSYLSSLFLLALLFLPHHSAMGQKLLESEVRSILEETAKVFDTPYAVAVTNREGRVLGVFEKNGSPPTTRSLINFKFQLDAANQAVLAPPQITSEVAIALARTASFFSNNQAPLSSRTVRFISGIHFPPGVTNTPNAALYGIENTNRGCFLSSEYLTGKEFPRPLQQSGDPGLGVITGKPNIVNSTPYPTLVNPGGVPIYRNNVLIGGVGVSGLDAFPDPMAIGIAEFAAVQGVVRGGGAALFPVPLPLPEPGEVFIDGIRLPFVGVDRDELEEFLAGNRPENTPPGDPDTGLALGAFTTVPIDSPTDDAPEGWLVGPQAGLSLTAAEVESIIQNCIAQANRTRAAIRLPPGQPCKMVLAAGDLDGRVLGLFRMTDATIFSVDVAVTKARNVVYFSGPARAPGDLPGVPIGTAVTARTISFGSQPLFPAGIGSQPAFPPTPADVQREGPFFRSLYVPDVANPCTQGTQPPDPNRSGIVFFPGSSPLYKNGVLVGGLGVSGDGVEQDDFVTFAGFSGFEPPDEIRADRVFIRSVRLPYFKFPRNPTTGVIPDTSPPKIIYANLSSGSKGTAEVFIDLEVTAGQGIDLEATIASVAVSLDDGAFPEDLQVFSPFFNFVRITIPDQPKSFHTISLNISPADVLGQTVPHSFEFNLEAETVEGDQNGDGRVDARDVIKLLGQMRLENRSRGPAASKEKSALFFDLARNWRAAIDG